MKNLTFKEQYIKNQRVLSFVRQIYIIFDSNNKSVTKKVNQNVTEIFQLNFVFIDYPCM